MSSGIDYEYQVVMSTNAGTAYGYISSGIQVDLPMYRGKLLLYIDSEISSGITTAKNQLVKDLVGDGWIVVERVIDHYSSPSTVRNQVISDYNSDTSNVKALYILGNLAIARSGVVFNDGHGAHQGHWPSDAFYADVNGTWTDSTKDFTNGANNFSTYVTSKYNGTNRGTKYECWTYEGYSYVIPTIGASSFSSLELAISIQTVPPSGLLSLFRVYFILL
jgi:hypothetical protein